MTDTPRVTSAVLYTSDVNRSIDFYCSVFACKSTIHDRGAALLLSAGGFQIYLIERGSRTQHALGGIGPQCLIWAAGSARELTDIDRALHDRGVRTDTHARGGVTFVTGRDPDGIRIMVAHPSPEELPRSVITARLFTA